MMSAWSAIRQTVTWLGRNASAITNARTSITTQSRTCAAVLLNTNNLAASTQCVRFASDSAKGPRYVPYPKYDETPSPFKPDITRPTRDAFKWKLYDGGPLPRIKEGVLADTALKGIPEQKTRDAWTREKALFGQNDYIDILGDGTVHPAQLIKAPMWLRGFRGNELQRLIRRLKYEGPLMRDKYPTKYHNMKKQIFFLYKKYNLKRRHAPFWRGFGRTSRIDDIKDKFTN